MQYKHLDEPLDEGRIVFECMYSGREPPSLYYGCVYIDRLHSFISCLTHSGLYSTLVWLNLILFLVIKLFIGSGLY